MNTRAYIRLALILGIGLWILIRAHKTSPIPSGMEIYLTHRCTEKELAAIGDSRDVWVRYFPNGKTFVNEKEMQKGDAMRFVHDTMERRAEPLVWVGGDKQLSYGEVVKNIDDLQKDTPGLVVLLSTPSQMEAQETYYSLLRSHQTPQDIYLICAPFIR